MDTPAPGASSSTPPPSGGSRPADDTPTSSTTSSASPASTPTTQARFDRDALEDLFRRLEKRLYNVVYRWVWDRDDAADIVQETFMKLWAMRDTVRPETADRLAFRIGVNLAASRRRRAKLWRLVRFAGDEDLIPPALRTAPMGERVVEDARVRRAIDGLSEKLRVVVVLVERSGLTYAEIAALLDIPEGTVASRRAQGMAALYKTLGASS